MKTVWILWSLLGIASIANAQHHDGHGMSDRGQHGMHGVAQPSFRAAPPVMHTAPPVMHAAPSINREQTQVIRVQPNVNRVQSSVTRVQPSINRAQGTTNRAVTQTWRNDGRHRDHRSDRDHRGEHRVYHSHGGTSVFVPFWWYGTYPYNYNYDYDYGTYPYSSSYYTPDAAYPNRIFICYEEDQVYDDRYHIACPHPISWYSTAPDYDTDEYRSEYRPEYVCPDYGASQYVEFSNSYDATTWWNNNCDRWIYTQ